MRKVSALLAFALLCLAVLPVFAQTETPNPDEPVSTVEAGMDDGSSMLNMNPLNLLGTDSVVFVRFAHTAADGPSIDVYVQELGDTPVVEDLVGGFGGTDADDRGRTAGENEALGIEGLEGGFGDFVEGMDFAVDAAFAHPSCDQLRDWRAEVDAEDV